MKCISIQQPWAWAIVNGYKPVENRNWSTKYRGPILIHAGQAFDDKGLLWMLTQAGLHPGLGIRSVLSIPTKREFQRGGYVGRAMLTDVVTAHPSPWFFGPFGFVLSDVERMAFTAARGQLGVYEFPEA